MSLLRHYGAGVTHADLPLDGCTRAIPSCVPACPPLATWPARNLIFGGCPRCSRAPDDQRKVARALIARRLIAARIQPARDDKQQHERRRP